MERRHFLQLGALASAAIAGTGGCMSLLGDARNVGSDGPEMDSFLGKLDAAMKAIADGEPLKGLSPPQGTRCESKTEGSTAAEGAAYSQADLLLVQKSLRSLLLVGALHELPEPARRHPGMVQRLNRAMPEMDDVVFGMTQVLADLSPGDRIELQRKLQREPDLPMRVAEAIDADAGTIGVPFERRMRLRRLASHVAWRLGNQPPGMLLDEYVSKVRKLAARNGYDEALQRQIAARASTAALLAAPPPAAPPGSSYGPPAAPPPLGSVAAPPAAPPPIDSEAPAPAPSGGPPVADYPAPPASGTAPPPPPPYWGTPNPTWGTRAPTYFGRNPESPPEAESESECYDGNGQVLLTVGGVMFGVGATLGIIGGVVVAGGEIAGAFLLTPGGILVLLGLTLLIVGGAIAAGAHDRPKCPD